MNGTSLDQQLLIRLRLLGAPQVVAGAGEAGAAVKALGDETEVAGTKSAFAAEKAFLFGESMYSLKRYAFWGLTAIGATGAGILKMGYDFDEAKAKTTGSLVSLVGGASAASGEVSKLIALTHDSGLGLDVLGTAAKNMLTFGFSVAQTNTYLAAFAAFSQKNGLGSGGLDSFASIFQNVSDTGWFTSRNLKSLEGLGVPGSQALGAQLGLSPQEWYQFTHGGGQIAAGTALPAIAAYLKSVAAKQPASLGMQFDRAKSYLSQIFGGLGTPVFGALDNELGSITAKGGFLSRVTAGETQGGTNGMLKAIDPSGAVLNAWQALRSALIVVTDTLRTLWGVASPFLGLFLGIASGILGVTASSRPLRVILYALAGGYITLRAAQIAWMIATKLQAGVLIIARAGMIAWSIATGEAATATVLLTQAQISLDAALDANPISIIILAVAALAIGFYLLYTRVKVFRDFVNEYWPAIVAVIAPMVFPLVLIATHIQTIWNLLKQLYNWVAGHVFKVSFKVPGAGLLSDVEHPLRTAERVATTVPTGGLAVDVADRIGKAVGDQIKGHVTELYVGEKKLGDSNSKAKLKTQARR